MCACVCAKFWWNNVSFFFCCSFVPQSERPLSAQLSKVLLLSCDFFFSPSERVFSLQVNEKRRGTSSPEEHLEPKQASV